MKIKTCRNCGEQFTTRDCKPCAAKRAAERYRHRVAEDPEWVEQMKAYSRAYSKAHPEKRKARRDAIKINSPEKIAAANAAERQRLIDNPERLARKRARGAQYMRDNYEKKRARRESYRSKNSAKIVARVAEWRKRNPGAVLSHANNRRARQLKAGGVLSPGLRGRLFVLQKGRCACCGLALGKDYHLDHIIPLAKGGPNVDSNIQLLRAKCNAEKSAQDPIDFMRRRGKLL